MIYSRYPPLRGNNKVRIIFSTLGAKYRMIKIAAAWNMTLLYPIFVNKSLTQKGL